jgi:hypothetical protein
MVIVNHLLPELPMCIFTVFLSTVLRYIVLLPGFQKGRDIKASLKEKGREQFWPKNGNLHRTRKNGQNFTPFRVNKMLSHKF